MSDPFLNIPICTSLPLFLEQCYKLHGAGESVNRDNQVSSLNQQIHPVFERPVHSRLKHTAMYPRFAQAIPEARPRPTAPMPSAPLSSTQSRTILHRKRDQFQHLKRFQHNAMCMSCRTEVPDDRFIVIVIVLSSEGREKRPD